MISGKAAKLDKENMKECLNCPSVGVYGFLKPLNVERLIVLYNKFYAVSAIFSTQVIAER